MREKRGIYRVSVGKTKGKRTLRYPGVDGRIILRLIFRKWVRRYELDQSGSG